MWSTEQKARRARMLYSTSSVRKRRRSLFITISVYIGPIGTSYLVDLSLLMYSGYGGGEVFLEF